MAGAEGFLQSRVRETVGANVAEKAKGVARPLRGTRRGTASGGVSKCLVARLRGAESEGHEGGLTEKVGLDVRGK